MATEHHHLNRYHHEQQQQRSRDASSSVDNSRECLVQSLNNRACVLIAMGNFPRANHFLEIALQKHKDRTQEAMAPNKIHENENSNYRSSSYDAMVSMHEYDSDDSDLDDDDEDFCCSDENDFGYGDGYDYDHEFSRHNTSPKNVSLDRHQHHHQHHPQHHPQHMNIINASANRPVLSNMISTPIRTFCYAGQRERRSPDQWMHHKVYALPIVMTPNEWNDAPLQDRSFVLIFNSAICNHLWGLELLRNVNSNNNLQQHQQQAALPFQRSFSIARMLYRLALENVSSSHRGNPNNTHQGIHGVDRLVYSAVFNNLSHVCKSLDGYQSEDAYRYDTFLLKSIYWYIDSSSSNQNRNDHHHQQQQQQHSNEGGDEGDAEILDSFLENVFYLIGVPPQVLPAAVA